MANPIQSLMRATQSSFNFIGTFADTLEKSTAHAGSGLIKYSETIDMRADAHNDRVRKETLIKKAESNQELDARLRELGISAE
jgi:hypothetical protein